VRRRRPCCGRRAFPPFRKIPENVSHAGRPERTKTCLDFYVAAVRLLYGRDIKLYVRLRRTPSLSGTWTCTDKNGSDATFITSLDPKQKLATIEAAGCTGGATVAPVNRLVTISKISISTSRNRWN
jgi:hypothetical protein